MLRTILLFICLLVGLSGPLVAQSVPGLGSGAAPAEAPAQEPTAPAATLSSAQGLIDVLQNPETRDALISQLQALVAAGGALPQPGDATNYKTVDDIKDGLEAAAEPPAAPVAAVQSLGRQIAEASQAAVEKAAETLTQVYHQLLLLPATLGALADAVEPDVVLDALQDLAFVIIVTYAAFIVLRLISRRISRRLSVAAENSGWLRTIMLSGSSTLIDMLVVLLAWVAGYAITSLFHEGFGVIQIRQSLYLNAFVTVELAKVAGRALLAPRFGHLRLIPISDQASRSIWRWLNVSITLLGYGLLLAVPIANASAGYFAGSALNMTISVIAVLMALTKVLRSRHGVSQWLHKDASTAEEAEAETPLLARLAAIWHWPLVTYLLVLLVLVLARPGNVLLPLLIGSGKIVATVVLAMVAFGLLGRASASGIALPSYVETRMPMLKKRLNAQLPRALWLIRMLILATMLGVVMDVVNLFDFRAWLASEAGSALLANLMSAAVISFVAFLLWLGLASWVEYKLNPLYGAPPSPREVTLLTLLRNAATIVLVVLTLMFVLSELGLDIAPLLASAGVLGLAIGFGAQKLVQDIITGIFIQFENAINVGDVISVGGVTGGVEKLTVRSVSIRDLQGVFHIIPFSSVDLVSNYMRDFAYHVCDMGIAYREDIDDAKQAMQDAFDELRENTDIAKNVLGDLEWFGLNSFGDSAIVLRARIKTVPGQQWATGRAYNLILKRIFDERGIEIPFPHQTIYFGEDRQGRAPALHVRTSPEPDATAPKAVPPTDKAGADEQDPGKPTADAPPEADLGPDRG